MTLKFYTSIAKIKRMVAGPRAVGRHISHGSRKETWSLFPSLIVIAELRRPPSGAPYSHRKEKETVNGLSIMIKLKWLDLKRLSSFLEIV